MPITQLIEKLSGKSNSRNSRVRSNTAGSEPQRSPEYMDCQTSDSFEVVAEVLPLAPGSQAGSLCSGSSNSDIEAASSQQQQQVSIAHSKPQRSSSSSAALLASSFSGSLPSLAVPGGKSATARALRARGKAMLRTESGLPSVDTSCCSPRDLDLQHQLSLESSSSMMDATLSSSLPYGSQVTSPRYMRSSTAPLPGSLRAAAPGSLAAAVQEPLAGAPPSKVLIKPAPQPAITDDVEDDTDDQVAPISPAAADDVDADEHCHWEDGVVATWLQGIDHTELLHGCDEELPTDVEHSCGKAAVTPAAPASPVPNTVYSSLLYN